jgi:glucosylceramidase
MPTAPHRRVARRLTLVLALASCSSSSNDGNGPPGGTLAGIVVVPTSLQLAPGDQQQVLAACHDAQGAAFACPDMTWTVTGGTRSSTSAAADTVGIYTAGQTTGTFSITAVADTFSASARVDIATSGGGGTPNVTVDATQTFQTIEGWEATLGTDAEQLKAPARAKVIAFVVDSIGLTRVRLQAQGNIIETRDSTSQPPETRPATNDNNDPNVTDLTHFYFGLLDTQVNNWVLPIKARVEGHGDPFQLNVCYVGFQASTQFQQKDPAEYVEFMLTVLRHLKTKFGLEPDTWEIRLEPDNGQSVSLVPADVAAIVAAAGPAARAAGFNKVKFAVPSVARPSQALTWLNPILADQGSLQYLSEVTYHRYQSNITTAQLDGIRNAAESNGLITGMLEHIGADYNELHQDLKVADNSVWAQYTLQGPYGTDDGGKLLKTDTIAQTYVVGSRTGYIAQYWHFVRPGAVRIGASSTSGAIDPIAFKRPDGRIVVVAKTTGSASLQIGGLSSGTYLVTYTTSATRNHVSGLVSVSNGLSLPADIPAAGVITIAPYP